MHFALRLGLLALAAPFTACTSAPRASLPADAPVEPPVTSAQPQSRPFDCEPWRADVEGLIQESLARGRSYEFLSELCRVAPLRLSGSPGAERAVEWAETAMRSCGLANVHREPVLVPHWERGELEALFVLDTHGLPGERLPILALGGSVATPPGGVSADLLVVTSFEELRERAAEARGKIVLFNRPMDHAQHDCFSAYGGAVDQRSRGAAEAAKAGARAALVRSMTMAVDDHPHTGAMRYELGVEQLPTAALSTRAADELARRVARGERVQLNLQLACRTLPDVPSFNIVGELVGREAPAEIVVVGGHLDAWDVGHGAHDDGAGCVHALEALRLIKERGLSTRRTLRVVMFMNEENGARGAEAYYQTHKDELGSHVLALESDAGGFTPRGFTSDAPPEGLALLREVARLLGNASADAVRPGGGGVDIGPLARAGVPLVGFRPDDERYFDHHHCARDTIDAVHPRELALGAGAISGFLYVVGNLPDAPPRNAAQPPAPPPTDKPR